MKAIFVGGTHHNTTKDITNANPSLLMTPANESKEKECYSLTAVKNKDGLLYAVYQHALSSQSQVNEILKQF